MLTVVAALIGIAVGAVGLWVWLRTVSTSRLRLAEDQRRALLADAEREAETTRREAQIEAREHAVQLRADLESEIQDSRLRDGEGRGARRSSTRRSSRPSGRSSPAASRASPIARSTRSNSRSS